jgi:hypothetical protein
MTVNRVRTYISNQLAAQEGQQQQAHGVLTDILNGKPGVAPPTNQDDLFAVAGAREAFSQLTPESQRGILARLEHNAREASGIYKRSDPVVLQGLFDRIWLPDEDPNKITSFTQLAPYFSRGLNGPDYDRLKRELEASRTPEGNVFLRDVNGAKRTAVTMMKSGIIGGLIAQTQPEKIDEAAYAFSLELDQKIEQYRKAGKNPRDLITPGKSDYVLLPEHVSSFLNTTPEQGISEQAAKIRGKSGGAATSVIRPIKRHITNDAEFNALPSGAVFIGPDGLERRKP